MRIYGYEISVATLKDVEVECQQQATFVKDTVIWILQRHGVPGRDYISDRAAERLTRKWNKAGLAYFDRPANKWRWVV